MYKNYDGTKALKRKGTNMSEEESNEATSVELDLDDLDDAAGGTVIRYQRDNHTWICEFTCPNCGSKNVDGIADGTMLGSKREAIKVMRSTVMTCRECGYSVRCDQDAWQLWMEN